MVKRYQIGLRYTGGARMLLLLSLNFGILPIAVPVGVRDFDIDGELWVKLRLIPTEPWVGAVSWAFVSLPKIKFELSPFRLFNLMGRLFQFMHWLPLNNGMQVEHHELLVDSHASHEKDQFEEQLKYLRNHSKKLNKQFGKSFFAF